MKKVPGFPIAGLLVLDILKIFKTISFVSFAEDNFLSNKIILDHAPG